MFAAVAQSALIVGALLVYRFRSLTRPLYVGLIMAFGSFDEAGASQRLEWLRPPA